MSETQAIPRIGQIGTSFYAAVDEPDTFDSEGNVLTYKLVNLTNANTNDLFIEFKRPDKTTFTKAATVFGSPANGVLNFNDSVGILDQVGDWEWRGIAGFNDGSHYPGSWILTSVGT